MKRKYVYVAVGYDLDSTTVLVYGVYPTEAKAVKGVIDEFEDLLDFGYKRPKNLKQLTSALSGQIVFQIEKTTQEN